jgi:prephenate dehydrogenase
MQRGAIDGAAATVGPEVADAELAVVCAPVDRIADLVQQLQAVLPPTSVVTDAGSTKQSIVARVGAAAGRAEFVGGHPLAGSHRDGPEAADARLFVDRVCVVTPSESNTAKAVERVRTFWESLGMSVHTMSPAAHDEVLARTSHLPHVAAFALALSVEEADLPLTASGFRDATRLAASRPALWSAILHENRDAVLKAVDRYLERLAALREAIDEEDAVRLENLLHDAKRIRDRLGDQLGAPSGGTRL